MKSLQKSTLIPVWENCYDGNWRGVLCKAAYQHPAKFSRFLIERIVAHAFEQGWVTKQSIIVDPFGGVACGGIVCAYRGLQWIGVELESRFISLANESFALHARHWRTLGCPQPVILQGDSRRLCELVRGAGVKDESHHGRDMATPCPASVVVGSPPYAESIDHAPGNKKWIGKKAGNLAQQAYGSTPGQLGAMKPGQVQAVVGSPPYTSKALGHQGGGGPNATSKHRKDYHEAMKRVDAKSSYADSSPGQLAALPPGSVASVISSPPYAESLSNLSEKIEQTGKGGPIHPRNYGQSSGQLSQLPPGSVSTVLGSPPYEGSEGSPSLGSVNKDAWGTDGRDITARRGLTAKYGQEAGQLGHTEGATFWEASKVILEQCHQFLPPGGHACFVTKQFVRNKRLVDFPGEWRQVCESVGFTTVCEHHALLTRQWEEPDLFEGTRKKERARKSFFRRLCEARGSPKIDWETVLCFSRD